MNEVPLFLSYHVSPLIYQNSKTYKPTIHQSDHQLKCKKPNVLNTMT